MEKQMVTIFVSVYNIGEYLERFFDCLDKQTFRNYKLLMIDDGAGTARARTAPRDAAVEIGGSALSEVLKKIMPPL